MAEPQFTDLLTAINNRQDQYALSLIETNPHWAEEPKIQKAAMAKGCVRVIRYLRRHDLIGGSYQQRAAEDFNTLTRGLAETEADIAALEKFFK